MEDVPVIPNHKVTYFPFLGVSERVRLVVLAHCIPYDLLDLFGGFVVRGWGVFWAAYEKVFVPRDRVNADGWI